jgi:cytochrome c biogenesis protein CcdA
MEGMLTNMEPLQNKSSRWRIFLTGLGGFLLAILMGLLVGLAFFRLGLYQWLIHLVPQNQPLVRLLASILLSFLGVGLAGAAHGALAGATLQRIDPVRSRHR